MTVPCSHCGVDRLVVATKAICDVCFRAWSELGDAGRRMDFEAHTMANRAYGAATGLEPVLTPESFAGWVAARDAHSKAQAAWDVLGKMREQRVGLASAERAP